jgi:hypothetical protein
VTNQSKFSFGTNATISSQYTQSNVTISIWDYPTFNGGAQEWISFSQKFLAVESSQGFEYIFQEPEISPTDTLNYKRDLAFIYDAFSFAWAESKSCFLVQRAAQPEKNGRKIYLDAQQYFTGFSMEDTIILENVSTIVNTKLNVTAYRGAANYNNTFNTAISNLDSQGLNLDPKIIKCFYLSKIQDKKYDTIKDQISLSTFSLPEMQTTILHESTIEGSGGDTSMDLGGLIDLLD